jgi:uncharacterized surface protein with fasciclin (FAS1) repeats
MNKLSIITAAMVAVTTTLVSATWVHATDMMGMDTSMTMSTPMNSSMMMSDHGMYTPYSRTKLMKSFMSNKHVILFFYSKDDNGMMLNAALDDHQAWLPQDTVILRVNYDTNKLLKRMYKVTTPNTLLAIGMMWSKQKIMATVTDPVTSIDMFLTWLSDYKMMQEKMMMKEVITMVWGEKMYSTKDIVSNVVNAPNLTTLVAAVKAAWLVATLQSDGPFTVFGPDNAAFAKLPAGTVETLVKPENKDTLVKILTYHVVSGTYKASDLYDGQVLTTVQWGTLMVSKKDGKIMLTSSTDGNVATIVTADVIQKNGVAHVIDTVLLPK